MEKINVAEILKDCPAGMELNCLMFENVYFDKVSDDKKAYYPILCYITDEKGNRSSISFTKNGCESMRYGAKCVIFPKGKTTWEGFQRPFKDGEIVATSNGLWIGITTGGDINSFIPTYCVIKHNGEFEAYLDKKQTWQFHRLATEEEKQKLFDAIKANGYKWNTETKTLEKLVEPKFRVGDKVKYKNGKNIDGVEQGVILSITDRTYDVAVTNDMGIFVSIADQDDWELVLDIEPKFKVGDRITDKNKFIYRITEITDKGYKLHDLKTTFITFEEADLYFVKVVDIFDINTLIPFESRVLVRSSYGDIWRPAIYGVFDSKKHYHYVVGGNYWIQCIPYEENKHLLGTTNDCDEFYKTW